MVEDDQANRLSQLIKGAQRECVVLFLFLLAELRFETPWQWTEEDS